MEPRRRGRRLRGEPPHPVDVHVGERVRMARKLRGMSQTELAKPLGLSFQQVQKFERGTNRVSAGRLFAVSRILELPISFFFDGLEMGSQEQSGNGQAGNGHSDKEEPIDVTMAADPALRHEILDLVRAYYGISDRTARSSLIELFRSLSDHKSD